MKVRVYRTYRFLDKDPVIDAMRTIFQDEKLSAAQAADISGLAASTLSNWFDGETRQPQNSSITAFTSSLGYVRRDELDERGQVIVGYRRARVLDFEEERDKGIKFADQQNSGAKKKRKKKANGSRAH